MQSKANTPEQYIGELPEDRRATFKKLREVIKKNLPRGFREMMCYGMIGYVVPHSLYPAGYHCNPEQPLPFINLAAQKNFFAVYHMGLYGNPDLLKWFRAEHAKASPKRLDMGKSCIRYKKEEDIPFELLGKLAAKVSPEQWIGWYEKILNRSKN